MLNKTTLDQSLPLAMKLAEKNKTLQAVQDTPLSFILQTCSTYGMHVAGNDLNEMPIDAVSGHLIDSAAMRDQAGINDHTNVVNHYVEVAGQAVSQSLSFVRNTVLPEVKDVLAQIEEYRAGLANAALVPYVIKPFIRSELFANPLLLELVERYADTPAREVTRRQLTLDLQEVKQLIQSGAAGFDGEVATVLGDEGDRGYQAVHAALTGGILFEDLPEQYAVGLHLACKALFNEPPAGTEMGLTDYNTHVSLMTEQSGRVVYQLIETYRRRDRLNQLYIGANASGEILVDNAVYLKLLEQGLTPEALIGNEMMGRSYSATELVAKVDLLTGYYTREMKLRQLRSKLEEDNRIREGIFKILSTLIANKAEEDLPVARATLQQRAGQYCATISDRDLSCLPIFVRNLVCHVFYAHTDARLVLETMDDLGVRYPDIDPRELALLTTIQYVSYWVAKQIEVS